MMLEPKPPFELEMFHDNKGCVVLVTRRRGTKFRRYFCQEVKPRAEALFHFWRRLGAA